MLLCRLADVLYTLGGNANLKAARAYYSKAVEVSGGSNARALWGVTACCANITEKVRRILLLFDMSFTQFIALSGACPNRG